VLFMDIVLLGVMIRQQVPPETIVLIALANPLQAFRTAAFLLFDPQLVVLGASAFVILDLFGHTGFMAYACIYPVLLGTLAAATGYWVFRRGDLV